MRRTVRRTVRRAGVAAATAAVVAGLTACGSTPAIVGGTDAGASTSAPGAVDTEILPLVPDEAKADGMLTIGTDATYAPAEFLTAGGTTPTGFDVQLFDAVAARIGLRPRWVTAPFDGIIDGVVGGTYEIGVSSFTVNADRLAKADMVGYFTAGTQWATRAGNPRGVDPDNPCGRRVAVQRGTVQVDDLARRSRRCTAGRRPAVTVDQFAGQDEATAAVAAGRDDAMLADSPVLAYAVKQSRGTLELRGGIYDPAPYGFLIKKGQTQFAQALAAALRDLEQDGTYRTVLDTWGVSQGAISSFVVNPTVG